MIERLVYSYRDRIDPSVLLDQLRQFHVVSVTVRNRPSIVETQRMPPRFGEDFFDRKEVTIERDGVGDFPIWIDFAEDAEEPDRQSVIDFLANDPNLTLVVT